MTKFQRVLDQLFRQQKQFGALIGGRQYRVLITRMEEDHVTLEDQAGNNRFDMHFTQVIVASDET